MAANLKITQLNAAAALTGDELIECVQDGANVQTTAGAIVAATVVNALDSTSTTAPLSAAQGKALNDGKANANADAADFTSGTATDGYVLTADGAGGAAWEEPSGGGSAGLSIAFAMILS